MSDNIASQLQKPFEEDDIQWRVQQAGVSGNNNPYVMVIPYVNNRAIQKRLDDVFGVFGWENSYKPTPDGAGYICGITIHQGDKSVTKWDGAEKTNIEPLKGGLSDAMKRAAVQLGIGRYLYQMDVVFAECQLVDNRRDGDNIHVHFPNKQNKSVKQLISWSAPKMPTWAVPYEDYSAFLKPICEADSVGDLKDAWECAYRAANSSHDEELMNQAVKAKDLRKGQLKKEASARNAAAYAELEKWLNSKIEGLSELPSESTVNNLVSIIGENLKTKTSTQPFDCSGLFTALEQARKARLAQLKK